MYKDYTHSALIILSAILFNSSLVSAAVISDDTYSLTGIDSDSSWNKIGAGSLNPIFNTISGDLEVSRTFLDAKDNNFMIEASLSSETPTVGPVEAGARLFARIHPADALNPYIFQEFQVRLQKEASDADNFIGLFDSGGNLLTDENGNDAKILVDWSQTDPRSRIRLRSVSDLILLDLLSPVDNSILESVSVFKSSFSALSGIENASIIGFGNLAPSGNEISTWEDIRVATWEQGTSLPQVPLPASVWLFGSGLIGLIGAARKKKS